MHSYAKLISCSIVFFGFTICSTGYCQKTTDRFIEDSVYTLMDTIPEMASTGGVSVDAFGFIYVADFQDKIVQVDPVTKKVEVFASGFYGASGNRFDSKGNLFQSNFYGSYISKISRNGKVETFADSLLSGPVGIAINQANELFVCNCATRNIIKVSPKGKSVEFAKSDLFQCPNGIAFDNLGNLFVVNYYNNNVVKIAPDGKVSLFAKTPGKLGNGHIVIANGILYITGHHGNQIYKVTMDGNVSILAGTGQRGDKDGVATNASFSYPNGIAVSSDNKILYINDFHGEFSKALAPSHASLRAIRLQTLSDIIENEISKNGIRNAAKVYDKYKEHAKYAVADTRSELNTLGLSYLYEGRNQEAEAVFKMNVKSYPNWALSYRNLGWNAYLVNDLNVAKENFEKALKLNPSDGVTSQRLKDIQSDKTNKP